MEVLLKELISIIKAIIIHKITKWIDENENK